ncbi:MAG: 3-oxoacyl-[acyl-carrier-protein] reductase [Candidatus Dormibacteria bacterium]
MVERPLAGQVALVTGGTRGIGRATVLALAQAGADVAIAFTSNPTIAAEVAQATEAHGVRSATLPGDLAAVGEAGQLVPRAIEALGRMDIVVNNAGITRDNLALRMSTADWDAVLAVDLTAAFHVCKAALRPMLKQRSGRIVNVASISGVSGNAGQSNYAAAKAGLIGLTKSLCREVGSRGITVNAVAPGFIATDMTADLGDDVRDTAVATIPVQRLGTPEEVAAAIRFLALPEASYISGCVLHVDGGLGA